MKNKIEVGNLQGKETLREIIQLMEIGEWFTYEGEAFDANLMTLEELATLLHILSNGGIDVEFVPWTLSMSVNQEKGGN
ncbi:hypothetical protein [Alicyclobacillus ferrooxydans]|uniref:Uncharacterized protein n=1 Tax=Alicyclobacillus ferrooxydans TaxID=471514 RepID=A0A0P9CC71_9BACL|nr:hypothetical protein [Alicyclobacillus ferrooxydans]KPV43174.1 hypothetical protein AN477_13880 [Alicyclobacillus ferrooxydans]